LEFRSFPIIQGKKDKRLLAFDQGNTQPIPNINEKMEEDYYIGHEINNELTCQDPCGEL
jgi:hypothetical protein